MDKVILTGMKARVVLNDQTFMFTVYIVKNANIVAVFDWFINLWIGSFFFLK